MSAVTRDDYIYLRTLLLNNSNVDENDLTNLKLFYQNLINSKRRSSNINTINELVNVLEKRGCVFENDITILEDIATKTKNNKFLYEVSKRRNCAAEYRLFANATETKPEIRNIPLCPVLVQNFDSNDVKLKVHELISHKMGNKWIDFARALNIVESKIDNLKIIYSNNSEYCVKEVLDYHERNAHPRDWKTLLLNALQQARRNDLKNEVNKLFDNFSK